MNHPGEYADYWREVVKLNQAHPVLENVLNFIGWI
jgi:hypothetical protein